MSYVFAWVCLHLYGLPFNVICNLGLRTKPSENQDKLKSCTPEHVGSFPSIARECLASYSFFVVVQATAEPFGFSWGHVVRLCFFCLLQVWLQRYGYLHKTQPNMAVLRSAQTMHSAIAAMQHKYGLNISGSLDNETIE